MSIEVEGRALELYWGIFVCSIVGNFSLLSAGQPSIFLPFLASLTLDLSIDTPFAMV